MNLRDQARGRECLVRTDACNGDSATVVLAHYRASGISGMGLKSPDILGAWCCSACHALVDTGRYGEHELTRDDRDLYLLRGVARTINALHKEGKIK
jgi:hypothetical protein